MAILNSIVDALRPDRKPLDFGCHNASPDLLASFPHDKPDLRFSVPRSGVILTKSHRIVLHVVNKHNWSNQKLRFWFFRAEREFHNLVLGWMIQMWSATKGRRTTWCASGLLVILLLIGGVRPMMSQVNAEKSFGSINLLQLSTAMDQSIPESIDVDGVTRTYRLYVPATFNPGDSALIIALHGRGTGGPGSAMEQYSELDRKADQEGFAVAYLDGLVDHSSTLNWNYYYDFFFVSAPDDIGFVRSVIDLLKQQLRPDPNRIYVTGTSAGGFMAQRVGVELSDRVAAIGVVEGGLYVLSQSSPPSIPNPVAPISVLFLKGDQDPNNQYCGAVFPSFGVTESSSDQDFNYWTGASADGCEHISPSGPLCESVGVGDAQAHVTPGTPSSLVTKVAKGCRAGTEVKFYRLLGGGDVWNQGPMNIPGAIPFNPDLDKATGTTTNDILWKFFREHPKTTSVPGVN